MGYPLNPFLKTPPPHIDISRSTHRPDWIEFSTLHTMILEWVYNLQVKGV